MLFSLLSLLISKPHFLHEVDTFHSGHSLYPRDTQRKRKFHVQENNSKLYTLIRQHYHHQPVQAYTLLLLLVVTSSGFNV